MSVESGRCSNYSILAPQADTHAIEAELRALDHDCQALEGLLEGHISICFLLDAVAGLDQRIEQAVNNSLFIDSFDHIYKCTRT